MTLSTYLPSISRMASMPVGLAVRTLISGRWRCFHDLSSTSCRSMPDPQNIWSLGFSIRAIGRTMYPHCFEEDL
jgi:hypothetical protein